jgi:phosphoribosylcarboxyaminoimidazole (NCAIR) mutase
LKTIVKLKKDMAAIVFAPNGVQLVYPDLDKEMPSHVALAASIILALQYESFLNYLADFTQKIAKEAVKQEVTH